MEETLRYFFIPRNRKEPPKYFCLFQGTPTPEEVDRSENIEAVGNTLRAQPCGDKKTGKDSCYIWRDIWKFTRHVNIFIYAFHDFSPNL